MSNNPDDLDDGLEYVVDSEEEVAPGVEIREDEDEDDDDEQVVIHKDTDSSSPKSEVSGKKRRKTDDKFKEKKRVKMEQDINKKKSIPLSDSITLAEFFTQLLVKHNADATQLDYFKKSDFVDASKYKEKRSLDNFKDFTGKYNKGLTLIVAISRVRIGDLFKSLGPKSNAIKVGKGYKFEMRDDTKYVIGTPERLLHLDFGKYEIKSIILDASYHDMKTHSVLDEPKLTQLLKNFSGTKIILY